MQPWQPFANKKIALCISGGIACYKSVELLRRLKKLGAYVIPVMTSGAKKFIAPLTLSALADEPVIDYMSSNKYPIAHTKLGATVDAFVVAPATANIIASYANGHANNPVSLALISTNKPIIFCPAMHHEMWLNPMVQANIEKLISNNVTVVAPEQGDLAGGDIGQGRLADLDLIIEVLLRALKSKTSVFNGKKVLVTAGGTKEPLDPVRYLTNRSSGKQGHELAREAFIRGADVTLLTSAKLDFPKSVNKVFFETAEELKDLVVKELPESDCILMAAAVSDFKPANYFSTKIKRTKQLNTIDIVNTPDVLKEAVKLKHGNQLIVGFAAETDNALKNAEKKLNEKRVDVIVVNDVSKDNVGFDYDTNSVEIISNELGQQTVELASKSEVASKIFDYLEKLLILKGEK